MPVKQWLLAIRFASTENPTLTDKQVEEAVGQSEKPTKSNLQLAVSYHKTSNIKQDSQLKFFLIFKLSHSYRN